jgi:hypothetical protein
MSVCTVLQNPVQVVRIPDEIMNVAVTSSEVQNETFTFEIDAEKLNAIVVSSCTPSGTGTLSEDPATGTVPVLSVPTSSPKT